MMMDKENIVIAVEIEMKKYCYRFALVFGARVVAASILWLVTGLTYATEPNIIFDRTFPSLSNDLSSSPSDTQCIQPLAWVLGDSLKPKLLVAIGRDFLRNPASDIRSILIWQTYSADGKNVDEVLANIVGSGIETGYAASIKGQPVALIVDYTSRVSLVKSSKSNKPTEVRSNEGKQIKDGSKARIIATENVVWLVTQQESEVVLDKYDANLKLVESIKVKSMFPSTASLMDAVTRDSGRTIVLATHELSSNVALARVRLVTVETATGKVINTASINGFNPVAIAYGNEVYFSRVTVQLSGKPTSEIWIGKLSEDGGKITDWRSHQQEFGTLFSTLAITDDKVNLIGAHANRLFIKSFSKSGSTLSEYQETSKFQSPLFGYPAIAVNNQLLIAQAYGKGDIRTTCGALRVLGLK